MEDEISLIDFLRVLVRRRRLILGGTALITVLSILYSLMLPRVYEAKTKVLVDKKKKVQVNSNSKLITLEPEMDIDTQLELFKSRQIAARVVKTLKLDRGEKKITPEAVLSSGIVKRLGTTFFIELTVFGSTPGWSRDIANTWSKEFIRYSEEAYLNENKKFAAQLRENFERAKEKIELQKKKIAEFLKKNKKIPDEILAGKEGMILSLQQKRLELSQSLDLFLASYEDSWELILDNSLNSIRTEIALLKKTERDNRGVLQALKDNLQVASGKGGPHPLQVKIPLRKKSELLNTGLKKAEADMLMTASKEYPLAVKLQLDVMATSLENREILTSIEYLERSLPKIGAIFAEVRKINLGAMSNDAIVQLTGEIRKRLNPFGSIGAIKDLEFIFEDMSMYITEKKKLLGTDAKIKSHTAEYNDLVLKSKSYEIDFETLETDYLALLGTQEALAQKIEEFRMKAGVNTGQAKLVESAMTPEGPSLPERRKIVFFSFIFSVLFFVFCAFLIDYYQRESRKFHE
ncbi:MAG: Wzz/FepE/Etk N-terminal domain-containing protein [Nitrospinota bacterium]